MKTNKNKKKKCSFCNGRAYFLNLFESKTKCSHCDKNGNELIIKEIKSKKN